MSNLEKPASELVTVLMTRDEMTRDEAEKIVAELRDRVEAGEDPAELLLEECGLETDYVFDLIDF